MAEKYGTLGAMIDYAKKSPIKRKGSKARSSSRSRKSSSYKTSKVVIIPTRTNTSRSKGSILKFIKEVHA